MNPLPPNRATNLKEAYRICTPEPLEEAVVYIVMIRLMLRRLTDNQRRRKS